MDIRGRYAFWMYPSDYASDVEAQIEEIRRALEEYREDYPDAVLVVTIGRKDA